MLNRNQIEHIAQNAAFVAYTILGLDRIPYSISFIEDPDLNYDGLLDVRSKRGDGDEHIADAVDTADTADTDDTAAVDTDAVDTINTINTVGTVDLGNNRTATIYLNLSKLTPFSTDVIPSGPLSTPEEKDLDENYRHLMKICTVVYHEMRHLYQRRAVELYMINQFTGGGIRQLESKKKCELWKSELECYILGEGGINEAGDYATDLESDADDFAYYLSNRYPINLTMLRTNKRIGIFKRKYDKKIDKLDS